LELSDRSPVIQLAPFPFSTARSPIDCGVMCAQRGDQFGQRTIAGDLAEERSASSTPGAVQCRIILPSCRQAFAASWFALLRNIE
jgi:hypothetical protein